MTKVEQLEIKVIIVGRGSIELHFEVISYIPYDI